jgi:hypothetical protein
MHKLTDSEVKAAFSAVDKAGQAEVKLRKAIISQRRTRMREGEQLLKPYLKKTGFDLAATEKGRTRRETELRRLSKEQHASWLKASAAAKKELANAIENWQQNVTRFIDGTLKSDFVPGYQVIATPFLIWPTHGIQLLNSNIQPWNNTANILGQWTNEAGDENLRFIFVWENSSDVWTIINIESYLQLNGECNEFEQGGILSGSVSDLTVLAKLNVWQWWTQPPMLTFPQATQSQSVLTLGASGGGFLSALNGGTVTGKSVNGNYDLRCNLFLVPPNGTAVFEVELEFIYENYDGGMVQAIFEGGAYQVMCPAVVIAILS